MKKLHWQVVMFVAIVLMLVGGSMSLWAIHQHNQTLAVAGITIVITVCVSWWFWVMFIIRTMININDSTIQKVVEIKTDVSKVKVLLKEYESSRLDK